MRRPIRVKNLFTLSRYFFLFAFRQAASVATLPSALVVQRFSLGASWVFSFPTEPMCELQQVLGHRTKATLMLLHSPALPVPKCKQKSNSYVHLERNISDAARP